MLRRMALLLLLGLVLPAGLTGCYIRRDECRDCRQLRHDDDRRGEYRPGPGPGYEERR
jgi:hypothetical protein